MTRESLAEASEMSTEKGIKRRLVMGLGVAAAAMSGTTAFGMIEAKRADALTPTLVPAADTGASIFPQNNASNVIRRPRTPLLGFAEHNGLVRQPMSVGSDGYVYGGRTDGSNQAIRSKDGFQTTESMMGSFAIPLGDTKTLRMVYRTSEGYVAYTSDSPTDAGSIWFTTDFTRGTWTLAKVTKFIMPISIGRPKTAKGGTNTILLVGDYGNGDTRQLHLSEDGGQTWRVIYTHKRQPGGTGNNTHIHHAAYDEHTGRIWLSCGDGVNNWFGFSDDLGASWVPVPAIGAGPEDSGTVYNHPTVVAPTSYGIVTTPDGSRGGLGVWMIDKNTGRVAIAHEVAQTEPYRAWARAPWAQRGDELYIMFPPDEVAGEIEELLIAGTADGGRSWYTMLRMPMSKTADLFFTGIVGPDAQGRLWMLGKRSGINKLYVATVPDWEETAVGSSLQTNRGTSVIALPGTLSAASNTGVPKTLAIVTAPPKLVSDGDIVRVTASGSAFNNSGATTETVFKVRFRDNEVLSTGAIALVASPNQRRWRLSLELHVTGSNYTVLNGQFIMGAASTATMAVGDAICGVASDNVNEKSDTPLPISITVTQSVARPDVTTIPHRVSMELIRRS